jgi:hypothetical protein
VPFIALSFFGGGAVFALTPGGGASPALAVALLGLGPVGDGRAAVVAARAVTLSRAQDTSRTLGAWGGRRAQALLGEADLAGACRLATGVRDLLVRCEQYEGAVLRAEARAARHRAAIRGGLRRCRRAPDGRLDGLIGLSELAALSSAGDE